MVKKRDELEKIITSCEDDLARGRKMQNNFISKVGMDPDIVSEARGYPVSSGSMDNDGKIPF